MVAKKVFEVTPLVYDTVDNYKHYEGPVTFGLLEGAAYGKYRGVIGAASKGAKMGWKIGRAAGPRGAIIGGTIGGIVGAAGAETIGAKALDKVKNELHEYSKEYSEKINKIDGLKKIKETWEKYEEENPEAINIVFIPMGK